MTFTAYKNNYYAYAISVLEESYVKSLLSVTKKREEIRLLLEMFMHHDCRRKYSKKAFRLYEQSGQWLDTLARFGVRDLKDKVTHKN